VADHTNRLAGLEELLDEGDRVSVHAQVVGVDGAAGDDQAGVVVDRGVADDLVDGEGVGRVDVRVHRLDLAGLEREQLGLGAGLLDRVARLLDSTCSTPSAARMAIFCP